MVDAGRTLIRGLVMIAAAGLLAMGCSAGTTALKEDAANGLAKVQSVEVTEADDITTVLLSLDRPVTYTSVNISDPPMMVIDLAGVELGEDAKRIEVGKEPVTYIDPSRETVSKRIARLEIGLSRPAISSISQDGSLIRVVFEKSGDNSGTADAVTPLEAPASMEAGVPSASVDEAAAKGEDGPAAAAPGEPSGVRAASVELPESAEKDLPVLADATTVRNISVSKSGKALSLMVEGDGRFADHKAFMVGGDRLVLDIFGVGSFKDKDIIHVGGECVRQVRMARHTSPDEKVRVVLDLACDIDYDVKTEGSEVVVAVAPRGSHVVAAVSPAEKTADRTAVPGGNEAAPKNAHALGAAAGGNKVETSMSTGRKVTVSVPPAARPKDETPKIYVTRKDGRTILSSSPVEGKVSPTKVAGSDEYVVTETKVYTGGKISFDIQDADLEKVIKLLADVAGLNLIVNPADVPGKVTLKLANVPWDQALDILLKIYNLDKVIEGNVLRVAPKAKLAEERKIDLRAIAEQKRLMEEAEDLYTKTFKIDYADSSELESKVKKILSKRGEATSNPRTNELIVTDVRDKIDEAGKLIGILDKQVNQILIEARIITVDSGYSRSLGVSWGLTRNRSGTNSPSFGLSGGRSPLTINSGQAGISAPVVGPTVPASSGATGVADSFQLTLPGELAAAAGGVLGAFSWGNVLKEVNLDLTIEALETVNKATTLAAPKVLTLENKAAQITSGVTLYVQTTSASGTKPEPLNANLSLTVTPRVTGDNYIIMDVNATNNQPASAVPPGSTAAIDTQSVQTSVLVKDGDTIVLGGIYTKGDTKTESRIPILGSIPLIGWLFKNQTYEEPQQELLIFITPKLVEMENIRT